MQHPSQVPRIGRYSDIPQEISERKGRHGCLGNTAAQSEVNQVKASKQAMTYIYVCNIYLGPSPPRKQKKTSQTSPNSGLSFVSEPFDVLLAASTV